MKNYLLTALTCISLSLSAQQTAGPSDPKTLGNTAIPGSDKSWMNTGNAATSDDNYATFGDLGNYKGAYTDYLTAKKFGFTLPSTSRIDGIRVYVENSDLAGLTADYSIRIIKNGAIGTYEQSVADPYQDGANANNYKTYGGETDLWGETWTAADINNINFGVAIAAQRSTLNGETGGRIDNIRIAIYYFDTASLPGFLTLPLNLKSFNATLQNDYVRLSWTTTDESNMDRFEIQRAAGSGDFKSIGTLLCRNQTSATDYGFTDYAPFNGSSTYRLKILEKSGSVKYSKVVTVSYKTENPNTLYPSPWRKGQGLFVRNAANERLTVELYDNAGTLLSRLTVSGSQVPSDALQKVNGLLRYKVLNEKGQQTGSGTMIVN